MHLRSVLAKTSIWLKFVSYLHIKNESKENVRLLTTLTSNKALFWYEKE